MAESQELLDELTPEEKELVKQHLADFRSDLESWREGEVRRGAVRSGDIPIPPPEKNDEVAK